MSRISSSQRRCGRKAGMVSGVQTYRLARPTRQCQCGGDMLFFSPANVLLVRKEGE